VTKSSKSNINKEDKALINLNENIYGTFENGAGQETVRHFFRSGSSGTIATMSAYDKDFSDAIYGIEDGRVTESRQRMITMEGQLIEERLSREKI
jgi:hypothetical protein